MMNPVRLYREMRSAERTGKPESERVIATLKLATWNLEFAIVVVMINMLLMLYRMFR